MEHGVDRLVIGFDCSDKDEPYMMIFREENGGKTLVNKFEYECAEELYSILLGVDDYKLQKS